MGGFGAKLGKGWCDVYPQTRFYFWFFTSVPILVKIHQKCECESARKWTRGQRKAGFIICPMLYAIAIGQIMIYVTYTSVTSMSVRVLHRQKCNGLHRMLPPGESR